MPAEKKEVMLTQGKKAFSLVVVIIVISITIIVYRYTDAFFRESMG
jgi:Ca2+-dependent lipid-binding protein